MTNLSNRYKNREVPTNQEIDDAIAKADEITNDYFRLRVKALIARDLTRANHPNLLKVIFVDGDYVRAVCPK
jgi:hypothetical protein